MLPTTDAPHLCHCPRERPPSASAGVITYAAGLLGVKPPPEVAFEQAEMSAMARSFWQDNLRVDNGRIRDELGVELAHPDYRAGLDSCAKSLPKQLDG